MLLSQVIFYALLIGVPLFLAAAAVSSFFISARFWVWVATLTATFQVYTVPIGGIFPSATLLAGLAAWRFAIDLKQLWKTPWIVCFLLLALWKLISMAWSPNQVLVIRNLIYALPLIFIFAAARSYALSNPQGAVRALTWALCLATVQSALVMVFRVLPSVEMAFLTSPVARLAISANVISDLFGESPNNVFDPGKSGGFFVNGNVAATFGGVCAMLAWYFGKYRESRPLQSVAVLHWLAVFFTGSKAGAMVGAALPLLVLLSEYLRSKRIRPISLIGSCLIFAVFLAFSPTLLEKFQQTGFAENSVETFQVRQIIWDFARHQFPKHPFLGLGSGGWEQAFVYYAAANGFYSIYPPHNTYIILWSEAGLPAVFLGFAFTFFFLQWGWRAGVALDPGERFMAVGLVGAFGWLVIQGLGENFGLFGEAHITPLIAVAAGIVSARWETVKAASRGCKVQANRTGMSHVVPA